MKRFMCALLSACMIFSSLKVVSATELVVEDAEVTDINEVYESIEGDNLVEEDITDEVVLEDSYEDVILEEEFPEEIIVDERPEEIILEEISEFTAKECVGDYIVNIHADAGVFPQGTTVDVRKVSDSEESKVSEVIKQDLTANEIVAKTVTFDITFTDPDGNEIEPEDGKVDVSVELTKDFVSELEDRTDCESEDNISVAVYHVEDDMDVEMVAAYESEILEETGCVGFEAEEFSSYSIVIIINKTPDNKAPVLKSIVVKNDKYSKTGTLPEVIADITDDKSGVGTARVTFYTSNTGIELEVNLKYSSKDKKYHGSPKVYKTTIPGAYEVTKIAIVDKAGNALLYDNKNGKKVPSKFAKKITITDYSAGYAPTVIDSFASPDYNSLATMATIRVGARFVDNTQTTSYGIARFAFIPAIEDGKKRFRDIEVTLMNSGDSKNLVMQGILTVAPKKFCNGTMTLRGITLVSTSGQFKDYEVVYGTLPKKNVTFINGESSVPEIKSVQFAKSKINLGSKSTSIDVIANVADAGGNIKNIKVALTDGTNKRIEVDNFKKRDNKTYTGTIKLSPNQSPGTYKITYAYIDDTAYNWREYEGETLTKALKNTKLQVAAGNFKYSIRFKGNGSTSGSMSLITGVKYGQKVTLPANAFKKTGYYFKAWNTKADGSGKTIKNKMTVSDLTEKDGATVTLYAQWDVVKYSIKYNANGGKGTMSPHNNVAYDKKFRLRDNTFTNGNKPFSGWNTKPDGTGKQYNNKASVQSLTSKNGNVITLYAQWGTNDYEVIYRANGGSGPTIREVVRTNESYEIQDNPFVYSGKSFICWNTKADGSGKSYYPGEKAKNIAATGAKTVSLYAQWQEDDSDD